MARGLPTVVRFPRECPKCNALTAMPRKAGTLAEGRTQFHLRCAGCRHEWSIEMSPPVVVVTPDRDTDRVTASSDTPVHESGHDVGGDRRNPSAANAQRMRVGLCGLLRSADRMHTVTVLYSLDARGLTGRLRLVDPATLFPDWLSADSRLKLSGYDGAPLYIRITAVQLPREGEKDDDHFAEFLVRQ